MRFVIGGSGRSGTGFFSRALTSIGLPCGHEAVFDFAEDSGTPERWDNPRPYPGHGPYERTLIGDASLGVALWPGRVPYPGRVLHVVRNPYDVLRSWLGTPFFASECSGRCSPPHEPGAHLRSPYAVAMEKAFPTVLEPPSELERAVDWILRSNDRLEMLENLHDYRRVRLEDVDRDTLVDLVSWLAPNFRPSRPLGELVEETLSGLGRDVNRHLRADREDQELDIGLRECTLEIPFRSMAYQYGY